MEARGEGVGGILIRNDELEVRKLEFGFWRFVKSGGEEPGDFAAFGDFAMLENAKQRWLAGKNRLNRQRRVLYLFVCEN